MKAGWLFVAAGGLALGSCAAEPSYADEERAFDIVSKADDDGEKCRKGRALLDAYLSAGEETKYFERKDLIEQICLNEDLSRSIRGG